jgi:excisionase family DNA binding protein
MSPSHNPDTDPVFLTPEQVRQQLGISLRTYQRHIATGRLHASNRTPGGHRRFLPSDLDAVRAADAPAGATA